MDYICGPLLLYSQDKLRMMDFFADVLEFDVDSTTNSASRDSLHLKMLEIDVDRNEFLPNKIIFSFKVKSEKALDEMMKKYNFFLYRKPPLSSLQEKVDWWQQDMKKILMISDIDQRIWQFEYDMNPSMGLQ